MASALTTALLGQLASAADSVGSAALRWDCSATCSVLSSSHKPPMGCTQKYGPHVQGCHAAANQDDCLRSSNWHHGWHSMLFGRGSQRRSHFQQLDGQRLQSAAYNPPCQMRCGPSTLHCAQQDPQVGSPYRQLVHLHNKSAAFAMAARASCSGAWLQLQAAAVSVLPAPARADESGPTSSTLSACGQVLCDCC